MCLQVKLQAFLSKTKQFIYYKYNSMSCQIFKDKNTGAVLSVLTETGIESKTYKDLEAKYGQALASDYYSLSTTNYFKQHLLGDLAQY